MPIKEILSYKTDDGKVHETFALAEHHVQQLDLRNYIDKYPLYCEGVKSLNGSDILYWISNHPRIHIMLLPDDEAVDN